jgi:hypothetical protein
MAMTYDAGSVDGLLYRYSLRIAGGGLLRVVGVCGEVGKRTGFCGSSQTNAPSFKDAALLAFKGVQLAHGAFRLDPQKAHLALTFWTKQQ